MIFNLLDFPCGVVKFGKESLTKLDQFDPQGDMVLRTAKKVEPKFPKGVTKSILLQQMLINHFFKFQATKYSKDMPISVQLVGLPYQEELCLRGLVELESVAPNNL